MIRFGVLGFGLHAERRLVGGFAGARHAKLTALSRRDIAEARESAATYRVSRAFASPEALCRCPEVDAIFVATPNSCHQPHTLLALKCGRPVLCEKPMALNAAECGRMIDAARAAHRLLGVAQVFRFSNSVIRLRERVAAGEIGRPITARAEFSIQGKGHPRKWMCDPEIAGGGPIADLGVHCIDALRYILNDEVAGVNARGMSDADSGKVEAAAGLLLQFSRGTLGMVLVSTRAAYRTPIEIVGEKGTLRASPGLSMDEAVRLELWRDGELVDLERVTNHDAFCRMLDAFALAVQGLQKFPCLDEEGLKNQLVVDEAYKQLRALRR